MSVIYDYAVSVNISSKISSQDDSFLTNLALVVRAKNKEKCGIFFITNPTDIAEYTESPVPMYAFNAGFSSIYLIVAENLDLSNLLLENSGKFFTLIISKEFDEQEVAGCNIGAFDGVVAATFKPGEIAEKFCQIKSRCSFIGEDDKGALNAFNSIFKSKFDIIWHDGQYSNDNNSASVAATNLGDAENYYNKGYSFYIKDSQSCVLGFFAAGGDSISKSYIIKEIYLDLQNNAMRFLQGHHSAKSPLAEQELKSVLSTTLNRYVDANMLLSYNLTINNNQDGFHILGNLALSVSNPIWRMMVNVNEL